MAQEPTPDIKSAIQLGTIAELVFLAIGGVIAFNTGEMFWIYGFAVAGSSVMIWLLARAGAFKRKDERR